MFSLSTTRALVLIAISFVPVTLAAQATAGVATDTADSHLGRGYDALKQDRYQAAADEFRAALALDSSLVLRARFPLAVALFEEHKSSDARKEFETVRRETGEHPNVSYYLGRLDIDDRNYASAIRSLIFAATKPPFPDTAYYLGFAYFKLNDLPNAEKWLKQAAELNPRDSRIPYQLGFVYRKEGREEDARKSLALSADLHRQDDSEAQLRAECGQNLDQGNRDDAHAVCGQLYHDDDADRLTALGMIYAQHRDLEAALKPFVRAAELSPQSPQVQYNLALTYFQMNRLEDARGPLEQSLKRWPDLFPLNALYGAVLLKLGREEQAFDVLRHANELNAQDAGAADSLYFLSLKLAEQTSHSKQFPKAIAYLTEASRLRPNEAVPHKQLAGIYTQLGKKQQADAQRKEAERLSAK